MSLLVHYSLKDTAGHDGQAAAMTALVAGLKAEGIPGLHYACYSTTDPLRFVGVMDFPDEATKQAFLDSAAFAAYRATVGPTFANPPDTTEIFAVASTRG